MFMVRRLVVAAIAAAVVTSCASVNAPPAPAGIRAPVLVSRVEPEYPPELREARVEGVVEISGTVPKEGGALRNPRVVRSDDARLEPLALDAVSRWIWQPGMQDGQAVDVEFTTTVRFSVR